MTKAKFLRHAPVLLVKDVKAAAEYYTSKCGFKRPAFYGDPPNFCILHRDHCELMLREVDDEKLIVPHWKVVDCLWNIYYWVDDAKALYEELKASGAIIDYELAETDYGCLEFGIQDLDGYDIGFGQDLEG